VIEQICQDAGCGEVTLHLDEPAAGDSAIGSCRMGDAASATLCIFSPPSGANDTATAEQT
jgi:hypothetical protein